MAEIAKEEQPFLCKKTICSAYHKIWDKYKTSEFSAVLEKNWGQTPRSET